MFFWRLHGKQVAHSLVKAEGRERERDIPVAGLLPGLLLRRHAYQ